MQNAKPTMDFDNFTSPFLENINLKTHHKSKVPKNAILYSWENSTEEEPKDKEKDKDKSKVL